MFHRVLMIFATCIGIGYMPVCPGTFATLAAIGIYKYLDALRFPFQVGILFSVFIVGVFSAARAERHLGVKDPSIVVIDEVVGYLITMFFMPFNVFKAAIGFFLFRFFDIIKPFPIKRFEKISGGWGIMLDDVIAGSYALVILRLGLLLKS